MKHTSTEPKMKKNAVDEGFLRLPSNPRWPACDLHIENEDVDIPVGVVEEAFEVLQHSGARARARVDIDGAGDFRQEPRAGKKNKATGDQIQLHHKQGDRRKRKEIWIWAQGMEGSRSRERESRLIKAPLWNDVGSS